MSIQNLVQQRSQLLQERNRLLADQNRLENQIELLSRDFAAETNANTRAEITDAISELQQQLATVNFLLQSTQQQIQAVDLEIQKLETSVRPNSGYFVIQRDSQSGLWIIRDNQTGQTVGQGLTPQGAIDAAEESGVTILNLEGLVDQAQLEEQLRVDSTARRDQGPGTISAADSVSLDRAATQNPAVPPVITPQTDPGEIPGVTVFGPSLATDPGVISVPSAPPRLPEARTPSTSQQDSVGQLTNSTIVPGTEYNQLQAPDRRNSFTSYIYQAIEVVSVFSKGEFTQEITGAQKFFFFDRTTTPNPAPTAVTRPVRSTPPATPATPPTREPGVAVTGTPGVEITGEFAAYFGTGDTGGAVNFTPTGLATVRDNQRTNAPITTDILGDQGFSDPTQPDVTDYAPAQVAPPTSGGQNVSVPQAPARGDASAIRSQIIFVTQDLTRARNQGNREQAAALRARLRELEAQLAQATPITTVSTPTQKIAKER